MSDKNFEADSRYQQIAEAYALDAIDFAKANFNLKLDWTDQSVFLIERMLERLHISVTQEQPSPDDIMQMSKTLGSYVGEVFRKNHGAEWGMVLLGGESFPGLRAASDGATFWPWGRVHNRLTNGPEDNVWHYYKYLVSSHGDETTQRVAAPKSWWQKLFGA